MARMRGTRLAVAGMALGTFGLYLTRRRLVARVLGLPAARYAVTVERDLAVTMPDGVMLRADHYAPRAQGQFPTILVRTPYGRGRDVAAPLGMLAIMLCRAMAAR